MNTVLSSMLLKIALIKQEKQIKKLKLNRVRWATCSLATDIANA